MKNFLITVCIFCMSFSVFATEYFVSISLGNDSNNGLSKESPWKTLKKVQQESDRFVSGDIIRFKTGDVWFESLLISKLKGTINESITFSSYGSGIRPIFTAVKEQDLTWTNIGGNIWRNTTINRKIPRLRLDGKEVLGTILYSELGSRIPDLVEFFYGDNGDGKECFYLYSISNPNTRKIEFSLYPDARALHIDLSENLSFENIEVQGGYFETLFISGSKNITLNNFKIGVMSKKGIALERNGSVNNENIIIDNSLFDTEFSADYSKSKIYDGSSVRGSTDGIRFYDGTTGEIKNSIFKNWGHSSISLTTEGNDKISNISIYNNEFFAIDIIYGGGITFDGNTSKCEMFNNYFFKTKDSQLNGYENHVHHNIFKENKNSSIHDYATGSGILLQNYYEQCHDNIIENNLFLNCEGPGIKVIGNVNKPVYNNIIRNNILYECGKKYNNIGLDISTSKGTYSNNMNTYENNLIYSSLKTDPIFYYGNYMNVAEFNSQNKDSYSNFISKNISEKPLFVNVSNDWHLQANSPAIDAGILPKATNDYDNNLIHGNGTAPDIGIYEFVENTTGQIKANAGSDQEICLGASVTLTASGGSGYSWSTGATTKSITVNPNSTTTYTVTASEGSVSDTDDVIVTVNTVDAGAGGNVTIEQGETVTLTARGGDSYLWNTGETTESIIVSPTSNTTYSVTAKKGGCEDMDTVKVTVNASTTPTTVTANAGSDEEICSGESVTLTASGGSSYSWSTGATTKSITVNPNLTTTYTVTVSDGSVSDTDDVIVTVNSVSADAGSNRTINEGESITLKATGGDSYFWNTGAKTKNITVTPNKTTIYSVTVYKTNCEDSDSVQISVNPNIVTNPAPASANAGEDMTICLGESVTLRGEGGSSYLWSTGESNKNINVSPARTTTYLLSATKGGVTDVDEVTVTVENCADSSTQDLSISTISVYPNPSEGIVNINLKNSSDDFNVLLVDLKGAILYNDHVQNYQNSISTQIDMSRFAKGIYLIRVENNTESFVEKVYFI